MSREKLTQDSIDLVNDHRDLLYEAMRKRIKLIDDTRGKKIFYDTYWFGGHEFEVSSDESLDAGIVEMVPQVLAAAEAKNLLPSKANVVHVFSMNSPEELGGVMGEVKAWEDADLKQFQIWVNTHTPDGYANDLDTQKVSFEHEMWHVIDLATQKVSSEGSHDTAKSGLTPDTKQAGLWLLELDRHNTLSYRDLHDMIWQRYQVDMKKYLSNTSEEFVHKHMSERANMVPGTTEALDYTHNSGMYVASLLEVFGRHGVKESLLKGAMRYYANRVGKNRDLLLKNLKDRRTPLWKDFT